MNFWIKLTGVSIFMGIFSFALIQAIAKIIIYIGENTAEMLSDSKWIAANQNVINQVPSFDGSIIIGIIVACITFYYGIKMGSKNVITH